MMMNLVWLRVVVEVVDSLADDEDDVSVRDENWHVTSGVGVSSGASDGKMTMMTNAFDLLFHH